MKVNECYQMKERKQKISQDSCLQIARAEPEWYAGAQTCIWITENNLTNADKPNIGLMEQILSSLNLNRAFKQVLSNKGSGGIDKMEIESLKDYLVTNKDKLLTSVLEGKYQPNPVLRVEIPKDDGKKRMLGIPTVVDRVVLNRRGRRVQRKSSAVVVCAVACDDVINDELIRHYINAKNTSPKVINML